MTTVRLVHLKDRYYELRVVDASGHGVALEVQIPEWLEPVPIS